MEDIVEGKGDENIDEGDDNDSIVTDVAEKVSTKRPLKKRKTTARNETKEENEILLKACNVLNEKEPDEDDVYGQTIAFNMRRIKDAGNKAYAKIKIQEILFQAEFGQLLPSNGIAGMAVPQPQMQYGRPAYANTSGSAIASPRSEKSFYNFN